MKWLGNGITKPQANRPMATLNGEPIRLLFVDFEHDYEETTPDPSADLRSFSPARTKTTVEYRQNDLAYKIYPENITWSCRRSGRPLVEIVT